MSFKTYNVTGPAWWAKVLGDPQPNYDETENQWSINVGVDQRGIDLFSRLNMKDKVKNNDDDQGDFVTFRRREFKKDGTPNDPIEVVDAEGNPWDTEKLIGNESKVKVRFSVLESKFKGKTFIKPYIWKITVLELKTYVAKPKADTAGKAAAKAQPDKIVKKSNKPSAKEADWQGDNEEEAE